MRIAMIGSGYVGLVTGVCLSEFGVEVTCVDNVAEKIEDLRGGKIPIYMEPVAAILSKKTGRPVRMSMNRTEVFTGTGPTSATYVRAKIGAKNDGTLVAAEAYLAYEAGAWPERPEPTSWGSRGSGACSRSSST